LCAAMDDPSELLQTTVEELEELRSLAAKAGLEDLQRALAVLMKAETELANASFPRLTLEMALVRMASLPPARDVAAMVRKLEDLERRLASSGGLPQGAPTPRPRPPEPGSTVPLPPVASVEAAPKKPEAPAAAPAGSRGWAGLVEFVRQKRRPVIASLLEHGSLLVLELPLLEIGFAPGSFHLEQLRDADNHAALSEMAREYFGQAVNLKVSAVAADKADAPKSLLAERQAEESDRKRRLKEDALAHPMVQAVKEIFSSEVVEVRPIDKGFV
jgi:DNA polymerase III subunit gamma/tau